MRTRELNTRSRRGYWRYLWGSFRQKNNAEAHTWAVPDSNSTSGAHFVSVTWGEWTRSRIVPGFRYFGLRASEFPGKACGSSKLSHAGPRWAVPLHNARCKHRRPRPVLRSSSWFAMPLPFRELLHTGFCGRESIFPPTTGAQRKNPGPSCRCAARLVTGIMDDQHTYFVSLLFSFLFDFTTFHVRACPLARGAGPQLPPWQPLLLHAWNFGAGWCRNGGLFVLIERRSAFAFQTHAAVQSLQRKASQARPAHVRRRVDAPKFVKF